jgi:hypothetical protein
VNLLTIAIGPPVISKAMLSDHPFQPLGRWLRWKLAGTAAGGSWGATFRVHCATNPVGYVPTSGASS